MRAVQSLNAPPMLDESTHYGLLKTLENNPSLSQRDLAKRMGISLGKVNFCLNALVAKGSIKINNFRNSDNKLAYTYLLTPSGISEKARMTVDFLQYKVQEYERLRAEIEELRREAEQKGLLGHDVLKSRFLTSTGSERQSSDAAPGLVGELEILK